MIQKTAKSNQPTIAERKWIAAWRKAAPLLQQIRDDELQRLGNGEAVGPPESEESSPSGTSGLIAFQAWMNRQRILELMSRDQTAS